jgi:hypothetical protein
LIAGDVRHRAVLGQIMAVVVDEMLARSSAVYFLLFIIIKKTVLLTVLRIRDVYPDPNFIHP